MGLSKEWEASHRVKVTNFSSLFVRANVHKAHNVPMREELRSLPFYRMGNQGLEHLLKVKDE